MKTWKIHNKELVFDEEQHAYFYDGKKCVSVTQILQYKFPSKYDGIGPEILKKAAERGTYYHECVEMYEKFGIESNHQEFKSYLELKEKYRFEVLQCELPIVFEYKDLVICGQTDLLIKEHNTIGLADEKYTAKCDEEYLTYQLNFYRLGVMQTYEKDIELLRGIHLKHNLKKYILIPIKEDLIFELLENYKESKNDNV